MELFAVATQADIVLFAIFIFFVLIGLVIYFFLSFWKVNQRQSPSPYSGIPLRYGTEIPYYTRDKVNFYLYSLKDFENPIIDWEKAAFCRETGRIFPNAVLWTGAIKVDWSFLQKKYRGNFISWGSLSREKQNEIRKKHDSFIGFQTEFSSRNPAPRLGEEKYSMAKPGPLYVDPETCVLMGWKLVPDTDLEVLIIQKPVQFTLLNIKKPT